MSLVFTFCYLLAFIFNSRTFCVYWSLLLSSHFFSLNDVTDNGIVFPSPDQSLEVILPKFICDIFILQKKMFY